MFVDESKTYVRSGKGGDGIVHFHKEKYVNRGGPDGGDGGKGGDVIIKVTPHLNTLLAFRHQNKFIGEDGKKGGTSNKSGKSAPDLVIPVPAGTMVFDAETGDLLGDLTDTDQTLLVCPGGRGGRGNTHFANSRRQAPRIAEKGEPGLEKNLRLELKLIADIGIVGMPNAGKSSLLASVSNARPKIANYPFTTLIPNLGVSQLDEDTSLILADIPGLIEGAHLGIGLGDAFLRHIQRTRVLIHVIDGLSGEPFADYSQINSELALFDPQLAKKPQIVVLNKIDLPDVMKKIPVIRKQFEKHNIQIIGISAVSHENLNKLLWQTHELLSNTPQLEFSIPLPVYRPGANLADFTIKHVSNGWQVSGHAIERAAAMTYWEYEDSIRRFQRIMVSMGVDQALRDAGVKEGENVIIGNHELTWQD